MTKFLKLTDLHFGFNQKAHRNNTRYFKMLNEQEDFDAVIVSGDLACNQQKQLYLALRTLREYFPDKDIFVIFGNHDYWVWKKEYRWKFDFSWEKVIAKQNQYLREYDIYHLQRKGPVKVNDVWLAGYDGWYERLDPPTNDAGMIPRNFGGGDDMHKYFNREAHKALEKIIYSDIDFYNEKSICVTHHGFVGVGGGHPDFSQSYKNLEALYGRGFDVVCHGHSHKRHLTTIPAKGNSDKDLRIYCAGGGYKRLQGAAYHVIAPEHWIIEI